VLSVDLVIAGSIFITKYIHRLFYFHETSMESKPGGSFYCEWSRISVLISGITKSNRYQ